MERKREEGSKKRGDKLFINQWLSGRQWEAVILAYSMTNGHHSPSSFRCVCVCARGRHLRHDDDIIQTIASLSMRIHVRI